MLLYVYKKIRVIIVHDHVLQYNLFDDIQQLLLGLHSMHKPGDRDTVQVCPTETEMIYMEITHCLQGLEEVHFEEDNNLRVPSTSVLLVSVLICIHISYYSIGSGKPMTYS